MNTTLYKLNSVGNMQFWSIHDESDHLVVKWGILNGTIQTKSEKIELNQSGRNLHEQIALQINARISRQRDRGYVDSMDDAKLHKGLNNLNLHRPMLAKKLSDMPAFDVKKAYVQYKYNGHRCLITNTGDEIIAYSRNGKIITTLDHITRTIDIPEGWTYDGEIYCHGEKLQTIASWAKRKQTDTTKLRYHVYDLITQDRKPYFERLSILDRTINSNVISVCPTWRLEGRSIKDDLGEALEKGYEGLMLRTNDPYQPGIRSSSLVKVKKALDSEFLILDVLSSKDQWGILLCKTAAGKTFKVPAPGNMIDRTAALKNKYDFIGKYVTVEFFEWTKDGIPFHPVAIGYLENI